MRKLVLGSLIGVGLTCVVAVGEAAPAVEPSTSPPDMRRVIIDVKGDGFDLAGCSATTRHRTLSARGDDRLLAIDVVAAARLGFRVAPLEGSLGSAAAFGGNLRITPPRGTVLEPSTGWGMFAAVDLNRDGVLDASDLVWPALRVARDVDGDGRLDGAEVELLAAIDAVRLGPKSPSPAVTDAYGNERSSGAFERVGRIVGEMADVRLAACEPTR